MDEEVHGFVKENVPPINEWKRGSDPFVPNGSDESAFEGSAFTAKKNNKKHHKRHNKKDVAERGMDEEVHGFVKENVTPINQWSRSSDPFVPNGSDSSAFEGAADYGPAFASKKHHRKHHKKDVAERGMDEEVHGFVKENVVPVNQWTRSKLPFKPNGSDPSAHEGAAFLGKKTRTISADSFDADA
jgi:hypothetical protein